MCRIPQGDGPESGHLLPGQGGRTALLCGHSGRRRGLHAGDQEADGPRVSPLHVLWGAGCHARHRRDGVRLPLTCSPRLITVSAPLLPTVHLKEKLTSIINSENESGIDSAVHLLETIVGNQSTGDVEISEESFDRIVSGMSMLVEYSPSPSALACLPKSLNICGYNSGLVKEADITSASASQSSVVPDAGMCVMNDNFNGFIKLVEEYLRS